MKSHDWIKNIRFLKSQGRVEMFGVRHALVATEVFLHERESMLKIVGPATDSILYMSAKEHTVNYMKTILRKNVFAKALLKTNWGKEKISLKTGEILSEYGYGSPEYMKIDFEGESIVVLRNSCIASEYVKRKIRSKVPVCSYIAGLIAGGMSGITGKDYDARETKCIAKGDSLCQFVLKRTL